MFLKSIDLTNFRNYQKLNFKFKKPITVLIGDNAQGKTNFLESVYFLATTKSTKADRDEELIFEEADFVRAEGELENETKLEIAMQKINGFLRKRITVNGVSRRTTDYSSNLVVVLFQPADINLVTGSPALRRYYIDQTLSQIDKNYKRTLSSYENIVVRKNRLLKRIREGFSKINELDYWLDQQVLLGTIITEKRRFFFDFLNQVEKKFGDYKYHFKPSEISIERLKEYKQREIDSASSLVGPHRDDFVFLFDEKELSKYGSRGEQRTAVLDLKLSEVSYIESVLNDRPILLLDDIFSELDESHRQHVVDLSKMQQTIISTVEFDDYLRKEYKDIAMIVNVKNGRVKIEA